MDLDRALEQMQAARERKPSRKERMFLHSCVNDQSRKHFQETVLTPVSESTYVELTYANVEDATPIWGIEDKPRLRAFWEEVQPGDYVFFYTGEDPIRFPRSGMLEYAAEVAATEVNLELSDKLWEPYEGSGGVGDNRRGPWPLILFFDDVQEIELHHDELREIADFAEDWNPQEFSTYSGEDSIRRRYGSIAAYVEEKSA